MSKPATRKRGGQPGNANNLKHGLYSDLVSVRDDVELIPMPRDKSDDELAFARVRLKQLVLKQRTAPEQHWLSYEKAIQHYIDRIAMITHRNAVLGRSEVAAYVTVMDMIRQANDEQEIA